MIFDKDGIFWMVLVINLVVRKMMRSANNVLWRVEMEVFLQDSFDTTLMDGDFVGISRGDCYVRNEGSTLDSGAPLALLWIGCGDGIPESNLGHMAAFSQYLASNA
jgi:hypothetical protein